MEQGASGKALRAWSRERGAGSRAGNQRSATRGQRPESDKFAIRNSKSEIPALCPYRFALSPLLPAL